jgi:hypothetical protein
MLEAVRVRPVPRLTRAFSSELVGLFQVVHRCCCSRVSGARNGHGHEDPPTD